MRLRHRYLVAGAAWALLLGPCAGLLIVGMAAGISWLWLFGDNPWPKATEWILPLIGIVVGTATAITCLVAAWSYGHKREALPQADRSAERRKILLLTGTPLALTLLLGALVWRQGIDYSEAMAVATEREAAFQAFAAARHRIAEITVDRREDGTFRVMVRLHGAHEGAYRLSWHVTDTGYRSSLLRGDRPLRLTKGSRDIEIPFDLESLARSYQSKHLTGGGAMVEEPFQVHMAVEPVLTPTERAALPPGEARRLDLGASPFRSQGSRSFPVRFIIRPDGTLEK